jgi:hypothetical protein
MKKYFLPLAALPMILFFSSTIFAQVLPAGIALKVVIIRHGEKPKDGDNLNCMGLNRALKLPAVLDTVTGRPDYTYVPSMKEGSKTSSVRMFQTVTPFAVQDSLTINTSFKKDSVSQAAADVLKKRGVVLMVWEHSNIPPLAKALVGKKHEGIIQPWLGNDFDSIWIIEFSVSKKNNLKFESYTIEQENIIPSPVCN